MIIPQIIAAFCVGCVMMFGLFIQGLILIGLRAPTCDSAPPKQTIWAAMWMMTMFNLCLAYTLMTMISVAWESMKY